MWKFTRIKEVDEIIDQLKENINSINENPSSSNIEDAVNTFKKLNNYSRIQKQTFFQLVQSNDKVQKDLAENILQDKEFSSYKTDLIKYKEDLEKLDESLQELEKVVSHENINNCIHDILNLEEFEVAQHKSLHLLLHSNQINNYIASVVYNDYLSENEQKRLESYIIQDLRANGLETIKQINKNKEDLAFFEINYSKELEMPSGYLDFLVSGYYNPMNDIKMEPESILNKDNDILRDEVFSTLNVLANKDESEAFVQDIEKLNTLEQYSFFIYLKNYQEKGTHIEGGFNDFLDNIKKIKNSWTHLSNKAFMDFLYEKYAVQESPLLKNNDFYKGFEFERDFFFITHNKGSGYSLLNNKSQKLDPQDFYEALEHGKLLHKEIKGELDFPTSEKEIKVFEKFTKNSNYELNENAINPFKIANELSEDNHEGIKDADVMHREYFDKEIEKIKSKYPSISEELALKVYEIKHACLKRFNEQEAFKDFKISKEENNRVYISNSQMTVSFNKVSGFGIKIEALTENVKHSEKQVSETINNQSNTKNSMENENSSQEQKFKKNEQYARGVVFDLSEDSEKAAFSVKIYAKNAGQQDQYIKVFADKDKFQDLKLENGSYIEVIGRANFTTNKDDKELTHKNNSVKAKEINVLKKQSELAEGEKNTYKYAVPNRIEIETVLTRDVEVLKTKSNKEFIKASTVHNQKWNYNGEWKSKPHYVDTLINDTQNINLEDFKEAKKGDTIKLVGAVNNEQYTDAKNNKRYNVKIAAFEAVLERKKENTQDQEQEQEKSKGVSR